MPRFVCQKVFMFFAKKNCYEMLAAKLKKKVIVTKIGVDSISVHIQKSCFANVYVIEC